MVSPKGLRSLTISDLSFINVEGGSITPISKQQSISTKSKFLNPVSSTPSLQSSFINDRTYEIGGDYVMKRIVFWLLAVFFSVLSINHSVKNYRVSTKILMLFIVSMFMTEVESEMKMTKVSARDGEERDYFGHSVSNYGERVIIGAWGDDNENGMYAGAAYIFEIDSNSNEWQQTAKLLASDGDSKDNLSRDAVSIYGDFAVIGADRHNNSVGQVYVFERLANGSWYEQSKLTASDGEAGDNFGSAVSIYDNIIAVAATNWYSGAIYIYQYNRNNMSQWTQIQKLDGFHETSIEGLAVYNNTMIMTTMDAICIFEKQEDGLWNETYLFSDHGGYAVDIYENTAIVGDENDDELGYYAGTAYIYTRHNNIWSEVQKITASDGQSDDFFGEDVSIYNDIIVIGATGDDDKGPFSGSIYIFEKDDNDSWVETNKIVANGGVLKQQFGGAVSIHDDIIVVGARQTANWTGATYMIRNWESCYSIWNFTENKQILLSESNTTSYLIGYEWSLCNFTESTNPTSDTE